MNSKEPCLEEPFHLVRIYPVIILPEGLTEEQRKEAVEKAEVYLCPYTQKVFLFLPREIFIWKSNPNYLKDHKFGEWIKCTF